jgi:general secretion pathway protein B
VSFILDALRKSEHERQRQAGPSIAEVPVARPASRLPAVLIAVGALLAVNLVVVLYVLLADDAPEARDEPVAAAPGPAVATPAPAAGRLPAAPTAATRALRPLAGEAGPETAVSTAPPPAPDPSLVPEPPAAFPPPAPQPAAESGAPRIDTLPPQATAGLPELNLDLHIYANEPAQRAAFINGRRYREGDKLPEGVLVDSITPEGVVLRYGGQRFLLPRP